MSVAKDEKHDQTSSRDVLIGRQLGDYRLNSRLASGGMARIYKGTDSKLQRQAAIKVLEFDAAQGDNMLPKRFQREARAVAALEHENIITIYQTGEEDGIYFLAMRLIKGPDLSAELAKLRKKNKLMEPERAIRIMEQVASALDYAHGVDMIHRDIKPSNILLDKGDKAVLTDFGLVLRASLETTMGTAFGTPRYIAPEQAISSNKAMPQSDIYSLAVIFYEILAGQTPFNGESPMEIALSHISDPPPPPRTLNPDIPETVERELLKALDKDPAKRHRSATAFVRAIKRGYGLEADPPAPVARAESAPVAPPPVIKPAPVPASPTPVVTMMDRPAALPGAMGAVPARSTGTAPSRRGLVVAALGVVALALLLVVLMGSGALELGIGGTGGPGAPIALTYDENTFTIHNGGDYTLNVQSLLLVRGDADNDGDDYSGDRVPRDILPPDKCFQILLQNRPPTIPDSCQPISQHRHGYEALSNPLRLHWRAEGADEARFSHFEVRYAGRTLARCETVTRGESKTCNFTWPVPPPTPAPD